MLGRRYTDVNFTGTVELEVELERFVGSPGGVLGHESRAKKGVGGILCYSSFTLVLLLFLLFPVAAPATYLSSRISFSLAVERSSIFFVSLWVTFPNSSRARLHSSSLIVFSFSKRSTASLMSRRIFRAAVR